MNSVTLGSSLVAQNTPPYVIAEIGVNHEGSLDLAKRLIREAKAGGCHAAKFQTYKAATLASRHSPAYWDTTKESTTSQFELSANDRSASRSMPARRLAARSASTSRQRRLTMHRSTSSTS